MSGTPSRALPKGYKLGEYAIESVLGIGGFGITYKARDTALNSDVAIKEYFPQAFASRDPKGNIVPKANGYENYKWGLDEFLKEGRALAKFKHNNIVRVLRFMEANGTAYMIMEYEEGESLGDFIKRTGGFLPEARLLQVFLPILSGLQAVHEAGLLHLDIKPDNIYLRSDGQPMLIDFGSARVSKKTNPKERVALTPSYSALEQYPTVPRDPGPWSDVYSMGATLYACIVGKPPVDVMKRFETMRRKYPDPLEPATKFDRPLYAQHIRECVVRSMQLDPKKRPQSAAAMQKALMGQSLEEAKQVVKPSAGFNTGFIGVRNASAVDKEDKPKGRGFLEKLLIGGVLATALSVFTVQILVRLGYLDEGQVYQQVTAFLTQTTQVAEATKEELSRTLKLDDGPSIYEDAPIVSAEEMAARKVPPFRLQRELVHTLPVQQSLVTKLVFLPNGKTLVSVAADGTLNLWSADSGKLLKTVHSDNDAFGAFAVSADGVFLAKSIQGNKIQVMDLVQNTVVTELKGHTDSINAMRFSPDGKLLVTASDDRTLVVWDVATGKVHKQLNDFTDSVLAADFAPSGLLLVSGDGTGEIRHLSVPSINELARVQGNKKNEEITTLSFSPDGRWIASGGSAGYLKLWNTDLSDTDTELTGGPRNVYTTTFSPDGKLVLAAGSGGGVYLWDLESKELKRTLQTDETSIYSLAVSLDSRWLAVAGESKAIKLYRAAP